MSKLGSILLSMMLAILLGCAQSTADDRDAEAYLWTPMMEAIHQLTWASANCDGRMMPGLEDLRLFLRKNYRMTYREMGDRFAAKRRQEFPTRREGCRVAHRDYGQGGWLLNGLWISDEQPTRQRQGSPRVGAEAAQLLAPVFQLLAWIEGGKKTCGLRPTLLGEGLLNIIKALDDVRFNQEVEFGLGVPTNASDCKRLREMAQGVGSYYPKLAWLEKSRPVAPKPKRVRRPTNSLSLGGANQPSRDVASSRELLSASQGTAVTGKPEGEAVWKRIRLEQGVSFELPVNWRIGTEHERVTVEAAVQAMQKWTVKGNAGLSATLHRPNGQIDAQVGFRFYKVKPGDEINQTDIRTATAKELSLALAAFMKGSRIAQRRLGFETWGWGEPQLQSLGDFTAMVFRYRSKLPHEKHSMDGLRARVYDGKLSFALTIRTNEKMRPALGMIAQRITGSLKRER